MGFIYYQTLEAVAPRELRTLRKIKEQFNSRRGFSERIKLWRKADILEGMEPGDARWGFIRTRDGMDKPQVISAIRRMSAATPRLTWLLYNGGTGGKEIVLKGGRLVT